MLEGQRLVLASTSAARRALMDRLGLPYECVDPACDESAILATDPTRTATLRAVAKAEAVARQKSGAVVLGADQVVDLDGELLGKPGSRQAACAQLRKLAGRTHHLVTAVAIVRPGQDVEVAHDLHKMTMRPLSDAEIERYVTADEPEGCAGSYKVEQLGIALFDRIEGRDATAIMGLPLMTVCSMLRRSGWALP